MAVVDRVQRIEAREHDLTAWAVDADYTFETKLDDVKVAPPAIDVSSSLEKRLKSNYVPALRRKVRQGSGDDGLGDVLRVVRLFRDQEVLRLQPRGVRFVPAESGPRGNRLARGHRGRGGVRGAPADVRCPFLVLRPDPRGTGRTDPGAGLSGRSGRTRCSRGLTQRRCRDFSAMSNVSAKFRRTLAANFSLALPKAAEATRSRDGAVKLLLELDDGNLVESVLIPMRGRQTVCVSSQVGCRGGDAVSVRPAGARLLETSGPRRSSARSRPATTRLPSRGRIGNVVFMGQGEPLENLDHVLKAIRILRDDFGYGLGSRRITVSTCGIPAGIDRLGAEADVNLAASLGAADDEVRSELMPVNRKHPSSTN